MHSIAIAAACVLSLVPVGQSDELTAALEKAQAAWHAHTPGSYEIVLSMRCYCSLAKTPPTFRVTNDTPVAAGPIDSRSLSTYEHYNTVEKLFAFIKSAIARHPEMMTVTYDDALGYPTAIDIDFRKNTFDDEMSFRVSGFKVLKSALSPTATPRPAAPPSRPARPPRADGTVRARS